MKKNLLNKVWLRVGMIVAVMTTTFAGTTWAAEEVYKTMRFGSKYSTHSATVNNYRTSWYATCNENGMRMDIVNFKNIGSDNKVYPTYVTTGDNGNAVVASVTTHEPIDAAITKVTVTFPELIGVSVNSIKLLTSSNGSTWDVVDNFPKVEKGTYSVTISSPAENLYYRIEADCAAGNTGANKSNFLKISEIEFYHENLSLVQAPVITSDPQVFGSSTTITIACPAPDSDATIEYSTDHGYNWHPYTGAFTLSETSTIMARASKPGMQTNQSSAVVTHTDDAVHFDWNLAQASYSSSTAALVTWTKEDATMTLTEGMAAANSHLGGTGGNSYTEISKGQTLTITPAEDYTIISVEITAPNATQATNGFSGRAWENATQSIEGQVVTVTPTIGTEPISLTIANSTAAQVIGVVVNCSPASSPYVTATGHQTVISGTSSGTFDVYYNRLESTSAVVTLCDENGDAATYDWIEVGLDENKDITFSVTKKNPNTTERTAYAILSVEKDGDDYYTPVIAVTQEAPILVTISSVGYGTLYYGKKNLEVPEGVTAATYYVVEGKLTQSSTYNVIPAGSGVVLNASQGTYKFYESMTADEKDSNNKLRGSDEIAETTGGEYYYALTLNASSDPKSVGFYWMVADGKAFENGAHKAYLALDGQFAVPAAGVKSFFTLLDDDDPTGIENVNLNENLNENIYNLAGQRISKMQKGINIINGKKILK